MGDLKPQQDRLINEVEHLTASFQFEKYAPSTDYLLKLVYSVWVQTVYRFIWLLLSVPSSL